MSRRASSTDLASIALLGRAAAGQPTAVLARIAAISRSRDARPRTLRAQRRRRSAATANSVRALGARSSRSLRRACPLLRPRSGPPIAASNGARHRAGALDTNTSRFALRGRNAGAAPHRPVRRRRGRGRRAALHVAARSTVVRPGCERLGRRRHGAEAQFAGNVRVDARERRAAQRGRCAPRRASRRRAAAPRERETARADVRRAFLDSPRRASPLLCARSKHADRSQVDCRRAARARAATHREAGAVLRRASCRSRATACARARLARTPERASSPRRGGRARSRDHCADAERVPDGPHDDCGAPLITASAELCQRVVPGEALPEAGEVERQPPPPPPPLRPRRRSAGGAARAPRGRGWRAPRSTLDAVTDPRSRASPPSRRRDLGAAPRRATRWHARALRRRAGNRFVCARGGARARARATSSRRRPGSDLQRGGMRARITDHPRRDGLARPQTIAETKAEGVLARKG